MVDDKVKKSAEIAVVVPSYNHAPYIEKCLDSIFRQTLHPKKLLVIDDGSKDNSPQIIENKLKECPFKAELIVRSNRGLCFTLNESFSKTSGDFFAYIGSDDYWFPTFLESRTKLLLERENAVLGYGHSYLVDENDLILDCSADHTDSWGNYPDGDSREMLLQGIAPISSTIFYRRKFLEHVKWNEKSRLEDYEMYLKLMNLGDFALDPQILSVWRQHGYNTSKDLNLMLNEVVEAQNRNFDDLKVGKKELEEYQIRSKFRYARIFLQMGEKKEALNLAKETWQGAASNMELLKFCLRLCVPMSVINFRRSLKPKSPQKQVAELV